MPHSSIREVILETEMFKSCDPSVQLQGFTQHSGHGRHLINASRQLSVVCHQVYESCQHECQIHGRMLPVLQVVFCEMAIWLVEMPVHIQDFSAHPPAFPL